jgi:hypothetical protein
MLSGMDHAVPDEFLLCIGDIVVSITLLESAFQFLAGSLILEHQTIGRIITVELAFRNLRTLTINLYRERHGEDEGFQALRELVKRAATLEDQRNQIVHSIWGPSATADVLTRIKTTAKGKHGIQSKFENITAPDLREVAQQVKELTLDVVNHHWALVGAGKAINNPGKKLW